jgi:hypothetical protein
MEDTRVCVILNKRILMVNKEGDVWGYTKKNGWVIIENKENGAGYNSISCRVKNYSRHRIIGYVFLGLDIDDLKSCIDHIDRNKLNNSLINLRIVSHQQNCFNMSNVKGYSWDKRSKKFQSYIKLNGKKSHLGYFNNEEDAQNAYLTAKKKYHKI